MKIAVIGNISDRKCGFQNFTLQTITALQRAGHDVLGYDGTYSLVYARREACQESFLPPDPLSFDIIHIVWHPATLNHYAGADWAGLRAHATRPILSQWNGCPAASCPFTDVMDVRWGVLGREPDHRQAWYPIPDWVTDLPEPNPEFTVGYSGVRGDGLGLLTEVCAAHKWRTNFSDKEVWLSQEDEIKRLARSTVNVCWYGPYDDRSGSAMVCLASKRPLVFNASSPMFTHLMPYANKGDGLLAVDDLEQTLLQGYETHYGIPDGVDPGIPSVRSPILQDLGWAAAVRNFEEGWAACR